MDSSLGEVGKMVACKLKRDLEKNANLIYYAEFQKCYGGTCSTHQI